MTRRKRRSSRKRKCSNSKQSVNLPIQPDCLNTTTEKFEDEKFIKNKAALPEEGVTQSSEESSDADSRENRHGAFKSEKQPNASDYKVNTAKNNIIFKALIKPASTEIITVTIQHSQVDPEIREASTINLQHQQPPKKCNADKIEQEPSANVKCILSSIEMEIENISLSGGGATLVIGNDESVLDEDEWPVHQKHESLLFCSATLNNEIHVIDQQTDRNSSLKFNVAKNNTDLKLSGNKNFSYRDNISIYKQDGYKNFIYEKEYNNDKILHSNSYPASKGSCSSFTQSDFSFKSEGYTSSQGLYKDCFSNIPPPKEFADDWKDMEPFTRKPGAMNLVQENYGSETDSLPITSEWSERHHYVDQDKLVENSLPGSGSKCSFKDSRQDWTMSTCTSLSECDHRYQTSEKCLALLRTSSTMNYFGKDKTNFWKNSIDNIKSILTQSNYQKRDLARRKTYPDIDAIDVAFQMEWKEIPNLLYQGQQRSSLTPLPPFFIQTLPRKQGKPERVSVEDIKSYMCFKECSTQDRGNQKDTHDWSRINHWSSSGTLSVMKSPEISPLVLTGDSRASFRFDSKESIDDFFSLNPSSELEFIDNSDIFRTDLCSHAFPEQRLKALANRDIESWQNEDPQEQGDFTESGFDEEALDSDYPNELSEGTMLTTKQFQIQMISSSPNSTSEYLTKENQAGNSTSECADALDTVSELDANVTKKTTGNSTEFKKRRQSVTILQTGIFDQRLIIQNNSTSHDAADVSQQFYALKECNEKDTTASESNFAETANHEPDNVSADCVGDDRTSPATKCLSQASFTTILDILQRNNENADSSTCREENNKYFHDKPNNSNFPTKQEGHQHNYTEYFFEQNDNNRNHMEEKETVDKVTDSEYNSLQFRAETANYTTEDTELPDFSFSCESQKGVEPNCQKTAFTEKKWQQDLKAEASCHLQLPTDPVQNDGKAIENCQAIASAEEGSDHWAKRRKQFKESKHCNSAGGSPVTSNQESVNSEETRSVDLAQVRTESEQRGIYTETFNATSWIFRGDESNSDNNPHCLGKRTRPPAIRERTVKIAKGTGDYPWGFRIQFSKPILVTEVDTNGAAEEAGLQIGDIVLAVNGTDVTSIPHSEAATLARQGPDILTLIVGSDISRCPNTPRPACRGYLHKRTQSGLLKGWRKRWFVLKHNGLFYYYKNKKDEGKRRPLDVMKLEGAEVAVDTSLGKPFVFKCMLQSRNRMLYFCSTSNQEMKRWLEAMERAVHPVHQNHVWVDVTHHNANLPPLAIKSPDCLGLLYQINRNKDVWTQHYGVLKDACVYFYAGIRSTHAQGGIYLQGYTVSEQSFGSKRTVIEAKPPTEEFKTFYLCADNAADNKRWMIALKASISKWLPLHQAIHDFMTNPPEQTRM
ncbi:uncharacterized protein pdzph1 [Stegostoma tigrinum]|uniref:uncharacterized protein pdzph1 n=1 Tax=Stegostoma tigrinum TaxID=3053191 RepID=UPI00202B3003|nr:uncharacterized protein pdzph1 [Stegostoma tigrinum]XP_048382744.1 uncharacterized protein pdzph1 [Stegostoma tigrinum]